MKTIKFQHDLVSLVLSGSKNSTWRLFDDKDLRDGDDLEFKEFGIDHPFAEAKITKVVETSFRHLSEEDKNGHEKYSSDDEMYDTYSRYYGTKVGPDTKLKIIWFELTKRF